MRSVLAVTVLLALGASAPAQNESWGYVVASKQEVLLSYGVPESDIIINFFCRPAEKQIEIVTTILPAKPRKGQAVKTTLTNGAATAAYAGQVHHHDEHGFHFAATTPVDRKVIEVLKSGTSLSISIPGKQHRVPLRGVARPLAQFEAACFGRR